MSLRQEATAEDANEVIEIMKSSMVDTFSDDFGTLDISLGMKIRKVFQNWFQPLEQILKRFLLENVGMKINKAFENWFQPIVEDCNNPVKHTKVQPWSWRQKKVDIGREKRLFLTFPACF